MHSDVKINPEKKQLRYKKFISSTKQWIQGFHKEITKTSNPQMCDKIKKEK